MLCVGRLWGLYDCTVLGSRRDRGEGHGDGVVPWLGGVTVRPKVDNGMGASGDRWSVVGLGGNVGRLLFVCFVMPRDPPSP